MYVRTPELVLATLTEVLSEEVEGGHVDGQAAQLHPHHEPVPGANGKPTITSSVTTNQ